MKLSFSIIPLGNCSGIAGFKYLNIDLSYVYEQ